MFVIQLNDPSRDLSQAVHNPVDPDSLSWRRRRQGTRTTFCPTHRTSLTTLPTHFPRSLHEKSKTLTIQIPRDGTSQLPGPLSGHAEQPVQVVSGRQTEATDKIFRRGFQIAVASQSVGALGQIVFGTSKISVRGDRRGAFEALQALFRFRLRRRVEIVAAEEFVGGYAFLAAEFLTGIGVRIIFCRLRQYLSSFMWNFHEGGKEVRGKGAEHAVYTFYRPTGTCASKGQLFRGRRIASTCLGRSYLTKT